MKKRILTLFVLFALCLVPIAAKDETAIMKPTLARAASFGQKNALAQAKRYLSFSAFSKKGLEKQLKFEGYKSSETKYAVKHCGANWNKQAVSKAKSYLKTMPMSKSSLRQQLLFEGFTAKQAKYGVKKAYK